MIAMSIVQPPQIGCGSEDITTNTSMTVIEVKQKRAYKRKDCGGDTTNTSTAMTKRKDCGDTNTSTVMEKKRRPCKRKDCGDTIDTPAIMEIMKKRPYRRKDCIIGGTNTRTAMEKRKDCGDANTSTVTEKKKRPYKRKDCGDTTDTPTVMEIKKKRPYRRKKCLPHDLIVEEIITKLPVPTLLTSVLVSKLWYTSIHNDRKRLTYSHFLESQKQPRVILSLLNIRAGVVKNTGEPRYACHFFKFTTGMHSHENSLKFDKFRGSLANRDIWELVGYCRGLPCMAQVGNYTTGYIILDPNRQDFIYIFYPAIVGKCISEAHIICHGFGFDPSANEYKLVSIFGTTQKELNVVVFTLGTKSWRNITASTTSVSAYGSRPITKIRAHTGSDKSAIFCTTSGSGGCLVWKIIATLGGAGSNHIQHDASNAVNNNEMEMLLSFNLHDEKFQLIQLPAKSTTDEQQKLLFVDYPHLLGFKGSPCIARVEKKSGNGSDYPHRCRDDHQGNSGSSSSCCCCCKVHLYSLKDNVKQVWVKEESFDVRVISSPTWLRRLAPDPCCFCSGGTITTPPTRIFSFSDQMLLYWFNGESLQVYNLRSGKLQLVMPTDRKENAIFEAKMKEPRHIFNSSDDDDIYYSKMDYQLHCHEENFLSLETFIPEGAAGVGADDFFELDLERVDRPCSAYVFIYRGSQVFYPSFN